MIGGVDGNAVRSKLASVPNARCKASRTPFDKAAGIEPCPILISQSDGMQFMETQHDQNVTKESRADAFQSNWMEAARIAAINGMTFKRCSYVHYQLSHRVDKRLVNVYPTKGRLWADRKRPRGPFLTGFNFHKPGGLTAVEFIQAVLPSCSPAPAEAKG